MTKVTIALIVLLSISTTAFADCNNPLLTTFGTTIVGTKLSTPSAITSSYCKTIAASSSCCSKAVRDAFQTQTDTLLTTLETAAKTKDEFIDDSRTTTIPGISTNIANLITQLTAVLVKVNAASASIDSATSGAWTKTGLTTQLTALKRIASYATGSTITADFTTYQKARATCYSALLKQQANAWCLACDGDYATKGVFYDDSTFALTSVTYGTDVKTRLVTACYPYISASATISDLLQASSWTATLVDAVKDALKTIADGTASTFSFTAFNTALTNLLAVKNTAVTNSAVSIPTTPSACTSTTCDWITTTLIASGKLSNDDATKGGSSTTELSATPSRLLLEEANRILAAAGSGTFNPAADDSGVTAVFPEDPAGVNPSGAMKLMSGLLCLGALFAALVL